MSEGRAERLAQLYDESAGTTDLTAIHRMEKDVRHLIEVLEIASTDHSIVLGDTTRMAITRLQKWVGK